MPFIKRIINLKIVENFLVSDFDILCQIKRASIFFGRPEG